MSKEIYRRFKRNAAIILGSRLIFGLLNVATVALIVRLFGLKEFGIVVLLHTYTRLFTEIVKFDSWQSIVTYGAKLQESKDDKGFKSLLGVLLGVDFISILLGTLCAILFVPFAAKIFEWPPQVADFAPFYVCSIFFIAHGTANGVLRLLDRVDVIATEFALKSTTRFLGVLFLAWYGTNVFYLVLVWFLASVVSGSWTLSLFFNVLHKHKLLPTFKTSWSKAAKDFKGIWKFLAFSNISSGVGFVYSAGTTLFVGVTLGAAPAAAFEIILQFAAALSRPVRLLGPIISPEFARLAAKDDWVTFRKAITKQLFITSLLLVGIGLAVFPILGFIVKTIYGPELLSEIWLFRLLLASVFFNMLTFTFEPAILSAGKAGTLLIIRASIALVYVLIVYTFLTQYGIVTAGVASLTGQILYLIVFLFFGRKLLRKRVRKARKQAKEACVDSNPL